MTSPAVTVAETASVEVALALLRERGLHRLPVTQDGKLVGKLESAHADNRAAELQPSAEELIAAGIGDL